MHASQKILIAGMFAILSAGCGGGSDPRLVGRWEGRPDLVTVMEIDFRDDGTAKVRSTSGGSEQVYDSRWSVVNSSGDDVTIRLRPASGNARTRKIKFLNDDYFAMSNEKGKKIGRFQRIK